MTTWPAIPMALGAAALFSVSGAFKHRSTSGHPDVLAGDRASGLVSLLLHTLRHPLWLTAISLDVGGLVLQALALHIGGLLLVQPLLVTAVAGTLVARGLLGGARVSGRQLLWSGLLVAALAGFVLPLQLAGVVAAPTVDRAPGYALGGVGVLVVLTAVVIARRRRGGEIAGSALGAAVGLLYATAAALLTLVTVQFSHGGVLGVLRKDEIYVLVVVGVASQVLSQVSYGTSPLAASAPMATAVDLVASVAVGIAVFDHPVPHGWPSVLIAVLSLLVAIGALFRLARGPAPVPGPKETDRAVASR